MLFITYYLSTFNIINRKSYCHLDEFIGIFETFIYESLSVCFSGILTFISILKTFDALQPFNRLLVFALCTCLPAFLLYSLPIVLTLLVDSHTSHIFSSRKGNDTYSYIGSFEFKTIGIYYTYVQY